MYLVFECICVWQLPAAERGSGQVSLKDIGQMDKLTKDINKLKK